MVRTLDRQERSVGWGIAGVLLGVQGIVLLLLTHLVVEGPALVFGLVLSSALPTGIGIRLIQQCKPRQIRRRLWICYGAAFAVAIALRWFVL